MFSILNAILRPSIGLYVYGQWIPDISESELFVRGIDGELKLVRQEIHSEIRAKTWAVNSMASQLQVQLAGIETEFTRLSTSEFT